MILEAYPSMRGTSVRILLTVASRCSRLGGPIAPMMRGAATRPVTRTNARINRATTTAPKRRLRRTNGTDSDVAATVHK